MKEIDSCPVTCNCQILLSPYITGYGLLDRFTAFVKSFLIPFFVFFFDNYTMGPFRSGTSEILSLYVSVFEDSLNNAVIHHCGNYCIIVG